MAEGKILVRVGLEYPDGWTERERDSERAHRERMAKISADEAYFRACAAARERHEVRAEALRSAALFMSSADSGTHNEVVVVAQTFAEYLKSESERDGAQ